MAMTVQEIVGELRRIESLGDMSEVPWRPDLAEDGTHLYSAWFWRLADEIELATKDATGQVEADDEPAGPNVGDVYLAVATCRSLMSEVKSELVKADDMRVSRDRWRERCKAAERGRVRAEQDAELAYGMLRDAASEYVGLKESVGRVFDYIAETLGRDS